MNYSHGTGSKCHNIKIYLTIQWKFLLTLKTGVPILIGTYWMPCIEFGLSFFSDMVCWHGCISVDQTELWDCLWFWRKLTKSPVQFICNITYVTFFKHWLLICTVEPIGPVVNYLLRCYTFQFTILINFAHAMFSVVILRGQKQMIKLHVTDVTSHQ